MEALKLKLHLSRMRILSLLLKKKTQLPVKHYELEQGRELRAENRNFIRVWAHQRHLAILHKLRKLRRKFIVARIYKKRRWHVRPTYQPRKKEGAWYTLIPRLRNEDPEMFFNYFRLTPTQFDELLGYVRVHLQKYSIREPISPGERLALTLRYLASGDSMISISYAFLVAPPTVSRIIFETCGALWSCLKDKAFKPFNEELWKEVGQDFLNTWNFPYCVGAIDGKHCTIQAFPRSGSYNFNYKQQHSLILLGICDARYRFLAVDIGACGRRNDSGVLRTSVFGKMLFDKQLGLPPPEKPPFFDRALPYTFVGDAAFPLLTDLMRPFPGKFLSEEKAIFNYRLSRARRVIENTFGVLCARWRVLRKYIHSNRLTAIRIIQAAVVLHNFIMYHEEHIRPNRRLYMPPRFVDHSNENGDVIDGEWRRMTDGFGEIPPEVRLGNRNYSEDAYAVRRDFIDYFMGCGAVPWQWDDDLDKKM